MGRLIFLLSKRGWIDLEDFLVDANIGNGQVAVDVSDDESDFDLSDGEDDKSVAGGNNRIDQSERDTDEFLRDDDEEEEEDEEQPEVEEDTPDFEYDRPYADLNNDLHFQNRASLTGSPSEYITDSSIGWNTEVKYCEHLSRNAALENAGVMFKRVPAHGTKKAEQGKKQDEKRAMMQLGQA
ncbi:MAG: hypothetical protein SGARI_007698 [Bacillariaceae sp.]